MSYLKNFRLGLLHVALAITFVAINGVLNRIMIYDLAIPASVVAALVVLPYVLSPLQVWIGQFSDTHSIAGYRRTPYILLGMLLAMIGMVLTPSAALMLDHSFGRGIMFSLFAFLLWGVGYNLAVVSYLSLASEMSNEQQRSRVIAVMWFMMITGVILSALLLGRALEPYSDTQLIRVFGIAGIVGMGLALLGLIGLEPRHQSTSQEERHSQRESLGAVMANPQARLFFVYLVLLLTAILGQDILIEPFGAQAFGMSVGATTQLTATWGGATLIALLSYGLLLNRWMRKKGGAVLGGVLAASGLVLMATSGVLDLQPLFVFGIAVLGFGTGIATATNLGLMLDMTTPEQAGLFIGAWGVADALARGVGGLLGGVGRDLITYATGDLVGGYVGVFLIEAVMLCVALLLLKTIDVRAFHEQHPSLTRIVAMAGDA